MSAAGFDWCKWGVGDGPLIHPGQLLRYTATHDATRTQTDLMLAWFIDVVADDAAKPVFAFALGGGGGGGGDDDDDDVGFAAVNPPPTAPPFPFPPLVVVVVLVVVGVVVFGALLFKLFPCFLRRFFALFAYHRF